MSFNVHQRTIVTQKASAQDITHSMLVIGDATHRRYQGDRKCNSN